MNNIPDLSGQRLLTVARDYMLRLTTREARKVAIEGDELVGDKDLAVALYAAMGQPIASFGIQDGVLSFDVGSARVRAIPDPRCESWNVAGPDKQLVVCMRGGELAIWS